VLITSPNTLHGVGLGRLAAFPDQQQGRSANRVVGLSAVSVGSTRRDRFDVTGWGVRWEVAGVHGHTDGSATQGRCC